MSMIERAARAVFAQSFHPDDRVNGCADAKWEEWPEDRRKAFRQARAVIEALMEPSEAMIKAASEDLASQFTDPHDVLSPDEEDSLGLEINGPESHHSASVRLEPYAQSMLQASLRAALNEGEGE